MVAAAVAAAMRVALGDKDTEQCKDDNANLRQSLIKRKHVVCEAMEAQLRQAEGELANEKTAYKKLSEQWNKDSLDLTTLRQLVAQLPVVDAQEVSVWLSPDESGWLVSKRPAFPAGLYWAKFRTQAEADSFRALLAYRATLAAGQVSTSIIGKQVPPSQWDKNAGVRGDIS